MKKIIATLLILVGGSSLMAQGLGGGTVTGNIQLDGQISRADSIIGAENVPEWLLMNARADILYSNGNFSAGLRYELYQNPLLGFNAKYKGQGIANYFVSYQGDRLGITAGNFYEQFGNGMIFRAYEDRYLGIDNAMMGLSVNYRPINGITIKGIIGKQRYYWEYGRGLVRGIDGEFSLNDIFTPMNEWNTRINLGAGFISKYEEDETILSDTPGYKLNLPHNIGAGSVRMNVSNGGWDLQAEYARKGQDPNIVNDYIYRNGEALFVSATYAQRGFSANVQAKRVDNMSFKSDYQGTKNDLDINFIPPINYTHTHSLPAIYTYATQPLGEMAMQLQVNYTIPKKTIIGGKYGTKITLDFSQVNDIKRNYILEPGQEAPTHIAGYDGNLGYTSPFFAVGDRKFFHDFNIEIERRLSKKWKLIAQYINLYYDMETIENHPGAEVVKANIGFIDLSYRITNKQSIRMELQHLWDNINKSNTDESATVGHEDVYKKRGNWAAALVEYSIGAKWFVSVGDKWNYGNPIVENRDHYYTASLGYIHESTRIVLTGGRQSEGMVCVGGVCRVVPASSGFSLSITTSF